MELNTLRSLLHLVMTLARVVRDVELYRHRNLGSKRFSHLPKITHLESEEARFESTQTVSRAHILNI